MRKIAIFVEGQTELIFVREYLLKIHDYQGIRIGCYTLFTDTALLPAEYDFGPLDAPIYFQIMNVGMDGNVLSRILSREKFLIHQGFSLIVGLRDMYSKDYRSSCPSASIDGELNRKFKAGTNATIQSKAADPTRIHFQFAIMETEAWLLGEPIIFERINPLLTVEYISASTGFDLAESDPETTIYHPAKFLDQIMRLNGGSGYDKSKGEVNSIVSHIFKEDIHALIDSGKCASFVEFHRALA